VSFTAQCPTKQEREELLTAALERPRSSIFPLGSGLDGLPLRVSFSPAHPLADIFHPPYPPIALQSISLDVPLARARAFRFPIPPFRGVAKAALYCAHRAPSSFSMILPSLLASLPWNGTRVGPTAAVERAHSDRARSGSKGSARVSFHPIHRARPVSKKGTCPLPSHPHLQFSRPTRTLILSRSSLA